MSKNLPSSSDYEVASLLRFSVFGFRVFGLFICSRALDQIIFGGVEQIWFSVFGFRFSASGGTP